MQLFPGETPERLALAGMRYRRSNQIHVNRIYRSIDSHDDLRLRRKSGSVRLRSELCKEIALRSSAGACAPISISQQSDTTLLIPYKEGFVSSIYGCSELQAKPVRATQQALRISLGAEVLHPAAKLGRKAGSGVAEEKKRSDTWPFSRPEDLSNAFRRKPVWELLRGYYRIS